MVRVLIVAGSATLRTALRSVLVGDAELKPAGWTEDPQTALGLLAGHAADLLVLDLDLPRTDALVFLANVMRSHPLPVVVLADPNKRLGARALEALRIGAVEVAGRPAAGNAMEGGTAMLLRQIKAAAAASIQRPAAAPTRPLAQRGVLRYHPEAIIAIGASTGGTRAIEAIMTQFPADAPGVLITQHMPANFTRTFAQGLDRVSAMRVSEATHGDRLTPGIALVAPGGHHMVLVRAAGGYRVELSQGPREHYQRPAVDVTFRSVARAVGSAAVGVLLTGMGADGAAGLLEIRMAGGRTIAQDEATSVVFGMPKEAIRMGAADRVLPIGSIAGAALLCASRARGAA